MVRFLGRIILAACLAGGFTLTTFGVLREAFVGVGVQQGLGEGGLGAGGLGDLLSVNDEEELLSLGHSLGLLTESRALSPSERRRNAARTILGTGLLAIYTGVEALRNLGRR